MTKDLRPAIIRAHEKGKGVREIARFLDISPATVWLRDNCPDFISVDPHWRRPIGEWPPNSPDLNPLDYSIWSILEEKACSKPHPNLDSLKKALTKAWNEIPLETLIKTVDDFPKRLAACIAANGGYFE